MSSPYLQQLALEATTAATTPTTPTTATTPAPAAGGVGGILLVLLTLPLLHATTPEVRTEHIGLARLDHPHTWLWLLLSSFSSCSMSLPSPEGALLALVVALGVVCLPWERARKRHRPSSTHDVMFEHSILHL
jgi:hypothetical protein